MTNACISRRVFFRWLPLAAAGVVPTTRGAPPESAHAVRAYHLETFYIAGYQHHEGPTHEQQMRVGTDLGVAFEPENPYDAKAVRLVFQNAHIGYVPRRLNRTLATLHSQGAPLTGRVIKINPDEPLWHRVKVEIAIPTIEERAA